MSHYKRHRRAVAPPFTAPKRKPQPERGRCAFCPMKSIAFCEVTNCGLLLCDKHRIKKAGGTLCPNHENAALVQYDGIPFDAFGDRGEAKAVS